MKTPRAWYRIQNQIDSADLFIYDIIDRAWFEGDAVVSAKQFISEIRALPQSVTTLRVHVNSPGGSVFEAITIANALRAESREHGRTVEMIIEGLAASAATIVTSAGDSVKIADNGMLMIHDPISLVWGPAPEMRAMADMLDKVRDSIIATYRWVSQLSAEKLSDLMAATTWMTADEALKNGLVTEIVAGKPVTDRFEPEPAARLLGGFPEAYRDRIAAFTAERPQPAAPAAPAAVLKLCREAGILALAEPLMESQADEATVRARLAAAKEIRVVCQAAKLEDLAEDYILAATPKAIVQKQVTLLSAKLDRVEIDAGLKPDADTQGKPTIDTAAIYAARNAPQGAGR